jgi:hypothetical protein
MPPRDHFTLCLFVMGLPLAVFDAAREGLLSLGGISTVLFAFAAVVRALTEFTRVLRCSSRRGTDPSNPCQGCTADAKTPKARAGPAS